MIFKDVDTLRLQKKSYLLHIFLLPMDKNEDDDAATAASADTLKLGYAALRDDPKRAPFDLDAACTSPFYAGNCGVFGGKGSECGNCVESGPIYVKLDASSVLRRLNTTRHDVAILCVTVDEVGTVAAREVTPLPAPVLEGPFFGSGADLLQSESGSGEEEGRNSSRRAHAADTKQLQRYLGKFGFYSAGGGDSPGEFGPATREAVARFQAFASLEVDCVVGDVTKAAMVLSRFVVSSCKMWQSKHAKHPEKSDASREFAVPRDDIAQDKEDVHARPCLKVFTHDQVEIRHEIAIPVEVRGGAHAVNHDKEGNPDHFAAAYV